MSLVALILAAGKGSRMKSSLPKVIHSVLGKPMIGYVLDAVKSINPEKICVVLGYKGDVIRDYVDGVVSGVEYIVQDRQLGTGHAVSITESHLGSCEGNILILNGDSPAVTGGALRRLVRGHVKNRSVLSLISSEVECPSGSGRIIRDGNNILKCVVEEKDASVKEKRVKEVNAGIYCVRLDFLWDALKHLRSDNNQQEYYLPDIVGYAVKKGLKTSVHSVIDPNEILGVNERSELVNMESYIRERILKKFLARGVTIIDPVSTFIAPDVKIGSDTIIYPGTYIYGNTKIGRSCTIGPNVYLQDSTLGKNISINFSSHLEGCIVKNNVAVGPFARLRPGVHIGSNSKIGNFVEIKESDIGSYSKVPHLSYVGDATVGRKVNIGAGTITCNYDGVNKNQTIIEDNVFIGSDSMLVAPVKVGRGSVTAAGSTITKDVEEDSLAIGRIQQKIIKGWAKRKKRE